MSTTDINHLRWIHDRLVYVYKENQDVDYLIKLRSIIAELEALQQRTCETCRLVGYRKSDGCSYCGLNNTVYCDPVKEKFCCNRYEPKEQWDDSQ